MEEERSVRYKLTKQPLASEREEIRTKKQRRNVLIVTVIVFLLLGFIGGYLAGLTHNKVGLLIGNEEENIDLKSQIITDYFNDYWLYGDEYEDLNQTLSDQAFHGMAKFEDDPYTTYQSNQEMNDFASAINMNFVGIGVSYTMNDDMPTITRVFKDAPADKAGLLAGDVIETVDGTDVKGKTTAEVKDLVVGEEGSLVKVGVSRQGQSLVFDIYRGPVDSTVYGYTYEGIPVLNILSFGENTAHECVKYLDEFSDSERLIIDLRDNSGGYQTAVEDIASLFLEEDSIVMRVVDKHEDEIVSYVKDNKYYDNFKEIAILINGNTASAAEVLTTALVEQHANAYTVGETSYGKGVVQSSIQLFDGSAIKMTTSKWLTPNGLWINGIGIKPDYEILRHEAFYETYWPMEEDETYDIDSVSEYVHLASLGLDYLGYDVDRVDGYFDESIANALVNFQNKHALEANGVLDKTTYQAIISSIMKDYATNIENDVQFQKAVELISEENK